MKQIFVIHLHLNGHVYKVYEMDQSNKEKIFATYRAAEVYILKYGPLEDNGRFQIDKYYVNINS